MRVTDGMRLLAAMRANGATQERLDIAAKRASAGARVNAPSDDPLAYAVLVRRGTGLASLRAHAKTSRAAADDLAIAERALDGATELMSEARSLAVQGANDAGLGATDRQRLADRVRAIREQIMQIANTRGSRGYVFGGTKTDTPPFDPAGAFGGNDGAVLVPVAEGVAVRGNASGARAFTSAGGRDVLADLESLATALDANDVGATRATIDVLGQGYDQIVKVQVESGLSIDRFRVGADLADDAALSVESAAARESGATDAARILSELSAATSAYEQSLEVTRRLLSMSSLAR